MMSATLGFIVLGLAAIHCTTAFELKRQYDKNEEVSKEHGYIFYDVQRPLTLKCAADESAEIVWYKNETKVSDINGLADRYSVSTSDGKKTSVFKIARGLQHDAGEYSCRAKGQTVTFRVAGNVFVKVHSNINTVEGETLRIHCGSVGTGVQIVWLLPDNSTVDEDGDHHDPRISVETQGDARNDVLIIDGVKKSDRGEYICEGRHFKEIPSDRAMTSKTYLRIKDKLAALWPFIGICSEVFLLCAIILIAEKRRAKIPDLDESDTDQSPNDHKTHRK